MKLDSFLLTMAAVALPTGFALFSRPVEFEELQVLSRFSTVILSLGYLAVLPALWKRGYRVGMIPWLLAGLGLTKIPIGLSDSTGDIIPATACLIFAMVMTGYVTKIRNAVSNTVMKSVGAGWNFMGGMWE
jgi:hypothetical protein